MNKLALALALSAVGATAGSAQIVNLNTASSIVTDRIQDGTWRREGNTDIYVRTRIDANGNRVVERARRDALGNYTIIDSRILNRDDNRGRTDNTWKRSDNENRVYVRTRADANGNRIMEKARRDANGNYVIFDTKVLGQGRLKDENRNGIDDRAERGKDGKWKKDKNGKKWEKGMRKGEGKHEGKHEGKDRDHEDNDDDEGNS
jgi:hypothetical protein